MTAPDLSVGSSGDFVPAPDRFCCASNQNAAEHVWIAEQRPNIVSRLNHSGAKEQDWGDENEVEGAAVAIVNPGSFAGECEMTPQAIEIGKNVSSPFKIHLRRGMSSRTGHRQEAAFVA